MRIKIIKTINNVTYEFFVEKPNDFDALFAAGAFASMPTVCKLCNSTDVVLTGNQAQDYRFVKMVCNSCNGRAQLGQYKKGDFYWKEWEKFEAQGSQPTQTPQAPPNAETSIGEPPPGW